MRLIDFQIIDAKSVKWLRLKIRNPEIFFRICVFSSRHGHLQLA